VRTLGGVCARCWPVTGGWRRRSQNCAPYMGSGRGCLAGDWPSTGGVLNITAAAWTAGFHWWRSGDITRTQNVSEYMIVLALCLVELLLGGRGPAGRCSVCWPVCAVDSLSCYCAWKMIMTRPWASLSGCSSATRPCRVDSMSAASRGSSTQWSTTWRPRMTPPATTSSGSAPVALKVRRHRPTVDC